VTGCATVANGKRCGHARDLHTYGPCDVCIGWMIGAMGVREPLTDGCTGYTDPKENQ